MVENQQFSLRWNNYLRHITNAFDSLRTDEDLVDVTLSCEGKKIRAHKMLLSACSSYFRDLFKENPCQHPVVIFRNVKFEDLSAIISFMYQGEVNVEQEQLPSFLTTAELLAVQGLTETGDKNEEMEESDTIEVPDSPVMIADEPVQTPTIKTQRKTTAPLLTNPMSSISSPPPSYSESVPPAKRKRLTGPKSVGEKENDTERHVVSRPPASRSESPDPIEIIPIAPVKTEVTDYLVQDQDDSSYVENHGRPTHSAMPPVSQMVSETSIGVEKSDLVMYSGDDSSLLQSTDSLSAADISQMLKAGPSTSGGGNDSQDSVQGSEASVGQSEMWGIVQQWMVTIFAEIKKLECKLDTLLNDKKEGAAETSEDDSSVLHNLPVSSFEEFNNLEKNLKESPVLRQKLIKMLTVLGGKDLKGHINHMMRRLIKDDLGWLFTLTGKSRKSDTGKRAFMGTEVSKIIIQSCQEVYDKAATEERVREDVGDWLHQAKTRLIRREKKQQELGSAAVAQDGSSASNSGRGRSSSIEQEENQ